MYASKLILDEHVDLRTLARRTAGMTGAHLSWDFVGALMESIRVAKESGRSTAGYLQGLRFFGLKGGSEQPADAHPTSDALLSAARAGSSGPSRCRASRGSAARKQPFASCLQPFRFRYSSLA